MANIVFNSPGPNTATTAIASSRLGSASITSIRRRIAVPSPRGKKAASSPSAMPGIIDSSTATSPIVSDRRAPCSRRDSMSRPISSVPSKKRVLPAAFQAGGTSSASRYCSIGLYGASTSASTAHSSTTIKKASPPTAPLFDEKPCQNSRQGDTGSAAVWSPVAVAGAITAVIGRRSSVADARVDPAVQHVDDQVHHDHQRGGDQDAALHHRIVAPADRIDQPLADTRP